MELSYWSVFTGIGGLDLGLDRAGFAPVLQCELHDYRREVAREHWPGVPMVRDVRVPDRVDRVEALGRAVVPQVAEYVARLIRRDAERQRDCACW